MTCPPDVHHQRLDGQSTENRKLVPVIRDLFQVTGKFIVATFPLGKTIWNEA